MNKLSLSLSFAVFVSRSLHLLIVPRATFPVKIRRDAVFFFVFGGVHHRSAAAANGCQRPVILCSHCKLVRA